MPVSLRTNVEAERAAVNAAHSFFEQNSWVFQDVDKGNDYGKDAYVDCTENRQVLGLCIALQIKGGKKYKRAHDYVIPVDNHFETWSKSSVPIGGIVYDEELKTLFWCNISQFLATCGKNDPRSIPVSKENILSHDTLNSEFRKSFVEFHTRNHPLLQLLDPMEHTRMIAIRDCLGLGLSDARPLIALRYMLKSLDGIAIRYALHTLSCATPHPDIFFHKGNIIPGEVEKEIRKHFRWSPDEIVWMLKAIEPEEWYRGAPGESLYMLFIADPEIESKMERVIKYHCDDEWVAWRALYLCVYWAGESGQSKFSELIQATPALLHLELVGELQTLLKEFGYVTLFE